MVFMASWLYMESAPPKETISVEEQASKDEAVSTSIVGNLVGLSKVCSLDHADSSLTPCILQVELILPLSSTEMRFSPLLLV